ncbi:hypothetical protein CEW81_07150 [Kluyvera genomosp. 3]|uniref:Invasin domain-containing protein n=1 Tax=Kluyvera genomosp. 3 TaxID=2774055 RepID=A0A248KI26_9ENTR|nr:hypothetical protein CEW81_07150 [Kluyvera genomosp. 3]
MSSTEYTIGVGSAVAEKSTIKTDRTGYISGDDMAVTVTLKDAYDNAVSGQASRLTEEIVDVQSAQIKPGSQWTEGPDGVYQRVYQATTSGIGFKATLTLNNEQSYSSSYMVNVGSIFAENSSIVTNTSSYALGRIFKLKSL